MGPSPSNVVIENVELFAVNAYSSKGFFRVENVEEFDLFNIKITKSFFPEAFINIPFRSNIDGLILTATEIEIDDYKPYDTAFYVIEHTGILMRI